MSTLNNSKLQATNTNTTRLTSEDDEYKKKYEEILAKVDEQEKLLVFKLRVQKFKFNK